jgi:hypothetical protein
LRTVRLTVGRPWVPATKKGRSPSFADTTEIICLDHRVSYICISV